MSPGSLRGCCLSISHRLVLVEKNMNRKLYCIYMTWGLVWKLFQLFSSENKNSRLPEPGGVLVRTAQRAIYRVIQTSLRLHSLYKKPPTRLYKLNYISQIPHLLIRLSAWWMKPEACIYITVTDKDIRYNFFFFFFALVCRSTGPTCKKKCSTQKIIMWIEVKVHLYRMCIIISSKLIIILND